MSTALTIETIPHVANAFLEEHDLFQKGWRFAWDNATQRAGCCQYRKLRITLSRHFVALNLKDQPDQIVDTILHEIAHALTRGHGHDDIWKAKCVEIGANPTRCYDSATVKMPDGRYTAKCACCARAFSRHKKLRKGYTIHCGTCGPIKGRLTFVCAKPITTTAPTPVRLDAPPPNPQEIARCLMPVSIANGADPFKDDNQSRSVPSNGPHSPKLRIPQARVLRALMPKYADDPVFEWPILNRAMLAVRAGYTAISGTVTRVLNGIAENSSTGPPHPGLLTLKLIETVEIQLDSGPEVNYRITRAGIRKMEVFLAINGNRLPPLKDISVCVNDKYRKTKESAGAD